MQQYWAEWRPTGNVVRPPRPLTTAFEVGDAHNVEHHLRLARESADPVRTPAAWSYVLYGQVSLELLRGDLDQAAEIIEHLHAALLRSRRFVAETTRAGLRMQLLVERGDTDGALAELVVLETSIYAAPIAWFRAWVLAEGGRIEQAAEALDAFEGPVGDDWLTTPLLTAAVTAAAAVGNVDFLRRHAGALQPISTMLACTGSGGIVLGPVSLALARAAQRLGEHNDSESYMATAWDIIDRMQATPWAARAGAR